ncbi:MULTISPECIES: histidine phosphatase family protein [unclassified Aerococcus]|uniref:histidine phosphatase family protein n=1 Tax=unclassified Aerococcus TaxID=2618060 RepID=UPI0025B7D927|nr:MULTISPECIES: histidine phosphatase family protein [unclassified Aerococcus]
MAAIHYYFVRHGETTANANQRVQGWADSPVTRAGMGVVDQVAETLSDVPFDLAYTSDLDRCIETGERILMKQENDIQLFPVEGFREYNFGGLEDQDIEKVWPKSISQLVDEMRINQIPSTQYVPLIIENLVERDEEGNSEDFITFWNRIEEAMLDIHDDALEVRMETQKKDIHVLIVSHDMPIRFFLHEVLPEFDLKEDLDYGHYAHVVYTKGAYELEEFNQV